MNYDPERLHEELERMRELIRTDPRVFARFDRDGNGVIDGDEWEEVRRVVAQRLEREAFEEELARELAEQPAPDAFSPPAGEVELPFDEAPLELAFDPRLQPRGERIADQVFHRDVARKYADVVPGQPTTLADHRELVLEQGGGVKQLFTSMFKPSYIIRDARNREVGRIAQQQNEMLQNMMDYDLFRDPNLSFEVEDYLGNYPYRFVRSTGMTENCVQVVNPQGRYIGYTEWKFSFLRRKYEVRVDAEGVSYCVQRRLLRPWTFDILDPFDEPIGVMQRGWSGIGFLAGANLFHISVETEITSQLMWGLLATALLADLDSEQGSRRSSLDFFNS